MRSRKWIALLGHAVLVLSVSILVLFILDIYNPMLGFMDSPYSRTLLVVHLVLSAVLAVVCVVRDRREQ